MRSVTQFPWMAALNASPVNWLLESDNPPVRYLTLTQILDRPPEHPEVIQAKQAVWEYPPAQRLLQALEDAPWDIDNLFRFGIPRGHPAIEKACDKWLSTEFEPGPKCYPQQTIGGLIRYADLDDPRLQAKVTFALRNQPFADGNRPGTSLRYGRRGACCGSHSCFSACVRSLWAIAGLPAARRTPEIQAFLQRGARFLASHRLFQSNHHGFKPIKRAWLRLHLPFALGWRTDLLDILDVATQIGLHDDPSVVDALRFLVSKQNQRGRWPLEESFRRHYQGLLGTEVKDIEPVGEESKWVTLSALTQLKRCQKLVLAIVKGQSFDFPSEPPPEPRFADYPFLYDLEDEARVRREWGNVGMAPVLEQLLAFASRHRLEVGWHWGLVIGPENCPEWCAASVRYVPSKKSARAWPVCRVCFLVRKGQFTSREISKRLGMPIRDRYPVRGKTAAWIASTLWRIGVMEWKDDYEEVGITIRRHTEFAGLRDLMSEALERFEGCF